MKARTIALLWVMAAAVMAAQMAPPSQQVAPESKKAAAHPAKAPAKPAAAAQSKPAAKAPAKPAAPTKAVAKHPAVPAKAAAAKAKKPAPVKEAALRTTAKPMSARDPFLSPIRESGAIGPACSVGKKCLAISTIVLRGIVKSQAGMIAVVESSTRKVSYFLRENDPVFNGYVVKITGDTIVFRENVVDRLGKQSTRDIVMKVVAPVV